MSIVTDERAEELLADLPRLLGDKWVDAWLSTLKKTDFFGDPLELFNKGLRQHAKPYWNPTNHQISIFSLGVIGASGHVQDYVSPGDQVMIPWGYALGGKNSALHGVAPQLKPLPTGAVDKELDLSPTSYNEWCAFSNPRRLSVCCKKLLLWSESSIKLVCQKCNACHI